jgi:hypothetical protein
MTLSAHEAAMTGLHTPTRIKNRAIPSTPGNALKIKDLPGVRRNPCQREFFSSANMAE